MTNTTKGIAATIKHVWTEPKSKAQMDWFVESARHCPSPMDQIMQQVGHAACEQFAAGGGWPDPDARVTVVIDESDEWYWKNAPDWDWWEPRHDQPWRRSLMRDIAAGYRQ